MVFDNMEQNSVDVAEKILAASDDSEPLRELPATNPRSVSYTFERDLSSFA